MPEKHVNGVEKHRNGVEPPGRRRAAFPLKLATSALPGRVELAIATVVVGTVFGLAFLIFNLPGPLLVQVRDDTGAMMMGARVSCADASGTRKFAGISDVFGEAKWPGLEKGMWFCHVLPPDRFHGTAQDGSAQVRSRSPATVDIRFPRPVHVNVALKRPRGSPRAQMAIRAICPATSSAPEAAWEARASVISGDTVLWLPFGRDCRAGLAKPVLPSGHSGLVEHAPLDCDQFPCTPIFSAASGASLDFALEPTPAQWESARPPVEPDSDAGTPAQ